MGLLIDLGGTVGPSQVFDGAGAAEAGIALHFSNGGKKRVALQNGKSDEEIKVHSLAHQGVSFRSALTRYGHRDRAGKVLPR